MKELSEIQKELKAPKGHENKFGKYKYRSCEDIVEAAKPILAKYGISLTMSDEVVAVLDRVYVKATATLTGESGSISTTAYARESMDRKGMDDAQITGATSSYARKYALNGLFAIDDTKDADTNEHREAVNNAPVEYISPDQGIELSDLISETKTDINVFLDYFKVKELRLMPAAYYNKAKLSLINKRDSQ